MNADEVLTILIEERRQPTDRLRVADVARLRRVNA